MAEIWVDVAAVVAAGLVLRARPVVVLAVILGTAVLVPAPLPVPHTHFSYLTVQHLVALAALGRLVDLRLSGAVGNAAFRAGPALPALCVLIIGWYVVGVVFSIDGSYSISILARLFDLATMLVLFVTFVVMTRLLDSPSRALQVAAVVVGLSTAIACVEHLAEHAWGQWLFDLLPDPTNTDAAFPLDVRGGQPRVRAGGEFALQYAWVAISLLPAAVVAAGRTRGGRFAAAAAAAFVLLGVYWSFSRSALAFGGVLLLMLALLWRDRRVVSVFGLAVVAALTAVLVHPIVLDHLSLSADAGSVSLRFDRLSSVLANLADHPFRGLGLGNLVGTGVRTTDNALLLTYAEVGALGLIALVVLFVVVVVQCAHATLAADDADRPAALACLLGALAYVASTQFYDAFSLLQGPQVLWFLVAVATVAAERGRGRLRVPMPSRELVLGTAAVAVAGAGVAVVLTPTYVSADYLVTTLPVTRETVDYDTSVAGKRLFATACAEFEAIAEPMSGVEARCAPLPYAAGVGRMRLEATSRAVLDRARKQLTVRVRDEGGIGALQVRSLGAPETHRSGIGLSVAALLPLGTLALVVLL